MALVVAIATLTAVEGAGHAAIGGQGIGNGGGDVRERAPGFTLSTLAGSEVSLSDYAGQLVIVNFWASWCNPCRREFRLLRRARRRHGDDLEVLGIVHRDIPADARRFVRKRNVTWPILLDTDGEVAVDYGVRGLPQTFFVNADGVIVGRLFGFTTYRELEREIRRALDT